MKRCRGEVDKERKKIKESSLRNGGSLGHYVTAAVADNTNITFSLCLQ